MQSNLYKLFRIACEDLNIIAEMEHNGMLFDKEGALTKAEELKTRLDELKESFKELAESNFIEISSGVHLSALLYGGALEEEIRVAVGVYKTGAKAGHVRYKVERVEHSFERLVDPLKKTETAISKRKREEGKEDKETQWSVSEDVLKELKAKGKAKELIKIILEYRGLEKLRTTYLEGWANLIDSQFWEDNMIHGNLNQCVAETGRLSSSKPNLQNADKETKKFLVSRYEFN
jgi:DNA polymerase I-like protein with 3'-5' exonuclease and polymerase domains